MEFIIRRENGEVRVVTNNTVAFEERTIDGVKCYVPIEGMEIEGCDKKPNFQNFEVIKAGSRFYALDEDAENKNRKLYALDSGNEVFLGDDCAYYTVETLAGQKCAYVYNSDDELKMIYLLAKGDRLEHPKHWTLSVTVLLDKTYVYAMKDGKAKEWYDFEAKEWYDFEKGKWMKLEGIREEEHIEIREFYGKAYVYICEDEMDCAVYDPETGRIFRGSPKVELYEDQGNIYVLGKNIPGKVKAMCDMTNGDVVATNWDQLVLRKFFAESNAKAGKLYAYDMSEDKKLMEVYSFKDKKRVRGENDHLDVLVNDKEEDIYVCDVDKNDDSDEIVGIFKFGEDWIYSKYENGHLEVKISKDEFYDCGPDGKKHKKYYLSTWQRYIPLAYFDD